MKTFCKIAIIGFALCFGPPGFAGSPGPCDSLTGDLFNLCNAYCVAKKCQTATPKGSAQSCQIIQQQFFQKAGFPLPCLQRPSISVEKKTDGQIFDPLNPLKLIVGTSVNWNYLITN